MAQSKRNFQSAQMNKDLDDRLVPPGSYRDALNVSVAFSEDGNVGALENLKGNELLLTQNITGLSAASNPNAEVIGSIAHPEEDKIYYFVTGDNTDGIFEYDFSTTPPRANTIIIDSSTPPPAPTLLNFTFPNASALALVAINGDISVSSSLGEIESTTENFNETVVSDTLRTISARVRVPNGYSNTNDYVSGTLNATQQAIAAPIATSVTILQPTLITTTTATLNGRYTQDAASLTDIGFYYTANTGGSSTVNLYSNKIVIDVLQGGSANISSGSPNWTDPFEGVPSSDVTVIDGNGNVISTSNYVYEQHFGPQPSTIEFISSFSATLPVTVAQTSTLTTINNALTSSQIVSSGTQVSLAGAITSPFSAAVAVLAHTTEHAVVAYVTNAQGTTFSDIVTFQTDAYVAPAYNTLPNNKLFIFPTVCDETTNQLGQYYPGFGDFEKADGNLYFAVTASNQSGLYADYTDLTNETGLLSNIGTASLTFINAGPNFPTNYAKTRSEYASTSAPGFYMVTASKTGFTSSGVQIKYGSPSNAVRTSNFTLNFAKTGTGAVPAVAVYDHNGNSALHWNASPSPLANFKIGPHEANHGNGAIMIPIANVTNVPLATSTTSSFVGFDPAKLSVSITGKTEGLDYDYYIAKEAMSIWGSGALSGVCPAVIIEADPEVLNNRTGFAGSTLTHTLNITYNY